MPGRAPAEPAYYKAHRGYRAIDALRYQDRRYGSRGRRFNLWLLERALRRGLAGLPPGALVLDVPCGTGMLHQVVHGLGHRLVGMDVSRPMLAAARRAHERDALLAGDVHAPPFRPRAFDAILCVRFLMLLPADERPRVLRELGVLTRGPIVATVCHPYTLKSFFRAFRRGIGRTVKQPHRLRRPALEADAAAAGLRVRRVIRVMPFFSEVWVVVLTPAPGA
jgi:SAM-dependent methyltransferase